MDDLDSEWQRKGATLSDKTARKEFGLTQTEIVQAIRAGKLQYRPTSIYGNPSLRLLRREVGVLVKKKWGDSYLKEQQAKSELARINRELKRLKTQIATLEERKSKLMAELREVMASVGLSHVERGPKTMRRYFAQARRAGFDIGLSTGKLTKAMIEVLLQLPAEAVPSKEVVVQHLGLLGQMSKTRDINAAWNSAKRQVVREHPDRFRLDGKVLGWASAMEDRPREKLSTAGHRKLSALAAKEEITPDELLAQMIAIWRRAKK